MNNQTQDSKPSFWMIALLVIIATVMAILIARKFLFAELEKKEIDRGQLSVLDSYLISKLQNTENLEFGYISKDGETLALNTKAYRLDQANISYQEEMQPCVTNLKKLNQPFFRFQRYNSKLVIDSITSTDEVSKGSAIGLVNACSSGFNEIVSKYEQSRTSNKQSWESSSDNRDVSLEGKIQ